MERGDPGLEMSGKAIRVLLVDDDEDEFARDEEGEGLTLEDLIIA